MASPLRQVLVINADFGKCKRLLEGRRMFLNEDAYRPPPPERIPGDGGRDDLDVWLACGFAFLILVGLITWSSEPAWR